MRLDGRTAQLGLGLPKTRGAAMMRFPLNDRAGSGQSPRTEALR